MTFEVLIQCICLSLGASTSILYNGDKLTERNAMNPDATNPFQSPTPTPAEPILSTDDVASSNASANNGKKTLATVSMILGIIGFLTGVFMIGAIFGAAAIVLATIVFKKKLNGKGLATVALITGICAVIAGATALIFTLVYDPPVSPDDQWKAERLASGQRFVESKKDFLKGETAIFGLNDYSVKVNSVQDNFVAPVLKDPKYWPITQKNIIGNPNNYGEAPDGARYMLINMTIKNIEQDTPSLIPFEFMADGMRADRVFEYTKMNPRVAAAAGKELRFGIELKPGESVTGNVVLIVPNDTKRLLINYEAPGYSPKAGVDTTYRYTLAVL